MLTVVASNAHVALSSDAIATADEFVSEITSTASASVTVVRGQSRFFAIDSNSRETAVRYIKGCSMFKCSVFARTKEVVFALRVLSQSATCPFCAKHFYCAQTIKRTMLMACEHTEGFSYFEHTQGAKHAQRIQQIVF